MIRPVPFFIALLFGGLVVAQEAVVENPLPPGIAWEADLDAALARARTEKKPVFLALLARGQAESDAVISSMFPEAGVVKASRGFVCVAGCTGLEDATEGLRTDGTKGKVSQGMGAASPEEFSAAAKDIRKWLGNDRVTLPQFVFLMPDARTVSVHRVGPFAVADVKRHFAMAQAHVDPGSAAPELRSEQLRCSDLMRDAVSKEALVRRGALKQLITIDDPRVIPFFAKRVKDSDRTVRREAAFYLGTPSNIKALALLKKLLSDRQEDLRGHAAIACGKVGLVESLAPLKKAIKKERKGRVKAHLMRAFLGCQPSDEEAIAVLLQGLKSRDDVVRTSTLLLIMDRGPDSRFVKPVGKLLAVASNNVRCAAYVTIGTLAMTELKKAVARKRAGERGDVRECADWCYAQLGGDPYEGEGDPEALVARGRQDELDYGEDYRDEETGDDRGRNGRGGRGGGRGGRGGGRGGGGRR